MLASLWGNRELILRMVRREVVGRYQGSVLGLLWSFLHPVLMLTVYTFVFSVVFKARWNGSAASENQAQFAIILFAGLIVHGLFSEVINRAPNLIVSNVNYVKKVVFPLEVLPAISLGSAVFHALVSLVVLLLASAVMNSGIPWTVVFIPLVLLPLMLLTLGAAWLLAALGVFVRDAGQATGLFTTVLLFVSPVFYPVSALPEFLRPWMMLNPLTYVIEQTRAVLVWGRSPEFGGLFLYTVIVGLFAWLGFFLFQRSRKGFADVL